MSRYALAAVPLAFLGLPLYVYLPAAYADLPAIGLAVVGMVLLSARLIDLVTDPLVGLLTDRLRDRISPIWLIGSGAGLMLAGSWWLFQPPADVGAAYLFLNLTLTYLGWTLFAIPYYVLGADLGAHGPDAQAPASQRGQTRVAGWREAGMIVGTLAALIVPVVLHDQSALSASALALLWLLPPAVIAVWTLPRPAARRLHDVAGGLWRMWRDTGRAARQLVGIHLLNALAGGTAATLFVLYTRDVLGVGQRFAGLLLLVYFVAGLLALPLWLRLARRIGTARAWRAAMLWAALGFLPAAVLGDGQASLFLLVCIATGATLGADVALPAAIQADIVTRESRRLERPRGGALFGLWGMAGKLALAIAAGLSLPLLGLLTLPATGFDRAAVTPILYAGLPVLIKLIAVMLLQRSVLFAPGGAGGPAQVEETDDEFDKDMAPQVVVAPTADRGRDPGGVQ